MINIDVSYLKRDILSLEEIKVGDVIYIPTCPSKWYSALSRKNPMKIKFPKTVIIKAIKKDWTGQTAMLCEEGYGWFLNAIFDTKPTLVGKR